ncbi:HAD-like domain-containing protein [Lactarius akahatsu]|uniref:HAD-like domain-containing protein n=1 Tax=Lactarius akahatsu TaxID=416441 RepID=A0AAD4LKN8_9AGAM|nr:HAD-like domain-containing protein [Lactarius akahatsu]
MLQEAVSVIPRPAIRALLIDLSGTVHVATQPTPGSPDAIQRLRASSMPFRFCSNTSKESTAALRDKLARMDIETRDNEVWTSIGAVNSLLRAKGVQRPLILASESAAMECRGDIKDDPALPYDSVVVAFAPTQFDYVTLNTAFRVLMNEHDTQRGRPRLDLPFIATHRARYVGDSDGALSLGPGPFVAALENASGGTAEIVGKPERKFFELVLNSLESEVQGREGVVAVIGDDIQSDLGGGAVELGFWRVLVRSGKYRNGDETKEGVRPPDEVCDSFASFVESLLKK